MTSINLGKGAKVDLTKSNPGIKKYMVGLGWNPNSVSSGKPFDIDCSVFIQGKESKKITDQHFVFYNNLKSPGDFVVHNGDNRTGDGDGDDEKVFVDFTKAGTDVEEVIFVATIHGTPQNGQNFGQIGGSYIRIVNADTNEELFKYDLNEDYSSFTAMTFGRIYKKDGEWKFEAVGTGVAGGLAEYLTKYGYEHQS